MKELASAEKRATWPLEMSRVPLGGGVSTCQVEKREWKKER
jgi:hypothetical protein